MRLDLFFNISFNKEVFPFFLNFFFFFLQSTPLCDILAYLKQAFAKGRLCYTIPWVVEFLSWMDSMSPMLDYYQNVFQKMLCIHRYNLNFY